MLQQLYRASAYCEKHPMHTDVIIDFRPFAGKSIFLENHLNQVNGQGPIVSSECVDSNGNPVPEILPAGKGNLLVRFDVDSHPVKDDSEDPQNQRFYELPQIVPPRITRAFRFDRLNGQWSINGDKNESSITERQSRRAAFTPYK